MKHRVAGVVFLGLCAAQAGRADLTMRHTFTYKFASFLPPQALDAMKQQLGDRLSQGSTLELKGDRVRMAMGDMYSVADYAKGEILLVDPKTKRFATLPLAEYAGKILGSQALPAMPPDAQRIFDNMKLDVKTSKTGKTETTHGIRTEESVLAISMEMGAGMQMRMEIHNWIASAEELKGTPALQRLANWAGEKAGRIGSHGNDVEGADQSSRDGREVARTDAGDDEGHSGRGDAYAGADVRAGDGTAVGRVRRAADAGFDGSGGAFDGAGRGLAVRGSGRLSTAAMEDLIKDAIGTVQLGLCGRMGRRDRSG